jgi:uncharacterized protein YjiS (DUF1127 family)
MNKSSKNNQIVRSVRWRRQYELSIDRLIRTCTTAYRLCRERHRQRRQLMEMDDRQLKDIGITRDQAEQEARKPIWKSQQMADSQLPAHASGQPGRKISDPQSGFQLQLVPVDLN